jgi:hypothetical protein
MWREVFVWGYRILVKVYEEPSAFGLKEIPRISKMAIYNGKQLVASYDRGWEFLHLPKDFFNLLMHALNHVIDLALGVFL